MAASTDRPLSGAARGPAQPAVEADDVLDQRYRLVRPVEVPDDGAPAMLWLARDEVLARPVAVRLVPAGGRAGRAAAAPFLAAASEAGRLAHPGLARVYDAATTSLPSARSGRLTEVAYVVSEWLEGSTLADLLVADGPLEPRVATRLALQAAEALDALHGSGLVHGRLHPGNVLLTGDDRLTLTDVAVAAALHDPTAELSVSPKTARADALGLAAVLYAMLTARWPAAITELPARGVTAAPRGSAGALVYAPRQVRAGIPRALDTLVLRALEPRRAPGQPALDTPAALVRALAGVDLGPVETPVAPRAPRTRWRDREPTRLRRATPALATVAFLVVVGVAFHQIGMQVGQLPRRAGAIDELALPSPGPSGGVGAAIDLARPPVVVRDFDPGDGAEQRGSVPNAYDSDPSTAWTTEGYKTARFGGLKEGVGLLVDLGTPTVVGSVKVGVAIAGADVQLRSANAPSPSADGYGVVASSSGAKQVATLVPSTATPARYWLVWFTKLPKGEDGRYREGIAELVFTRGR